MVFVVNLGKKKAVQPLKQPNETKQPPPIKGGGSTEVSNNKQPPTPVSDYKISQIKLKKFVNLVL
jgi:hypothetical protein